MDTSKMHRLRWIVIMGLAVLLMFMVVLVGSMSSLM